MNDALTRPNHRAHGRGRISLLISTLCTALLAGVMALLPGSASAATTICSSQTNTVNGYWYSFWTEGSGSACMTFGSAGNYSTSWSNAGNFVGGLGWSTGGRK
ncbi:MAG: 1,4-beta-xylanase, partial [Catenulispora sp.]|nr:1,4-beta-xylanase [Catenulispora sp.]